MYPVNRLIFKEGELYAVNLDIGFADVDNIVKWDYTFRLNKVTLMQSVNKKIYEIVERTDEGYFYGNG